MVVTMDIAEAAHAICEAELIGNRISPPHDVLFHTDTSRLYAEKINDAGLDVTGEEIVAAIIAVRKWDKHSAWPGHPAASEVIEYLREKGL